MTGAARMRDAWMRMLALALVTGLVSGCGNDDDDFFTPAAPDLGVQIERVGRAAINTAVVDPFNLDDADHGLVQDGYNAVSDPSEWGQFSTRMATNLAILDGLDTVCGNQLLAGPAAEPGRYDALAGVLADDRLFVNTASATCGQYLAVEADFLGISNDDCGGRTPSYDVVDVSYSVLATGALTGVGDGIPSDVDGAPSTSFPFLNAPN